MADIINLNKARKAKKTTAKQAQASNNRVKFGQTKAERKRATAEEALKQKQLDQIKKDDE